MIEKVKLPKDVCDSLDFAVNQTEMTNTQIVKAVYHKAHAFDELEILNEQNADEIMRALVLGYEPELSAEELMKEVYFLPYEPEATPETMEEAFKEGVRTALDIHGIHYDWMSDAE
jgi:hypothetical protein